MNDNLDFAEQLRNEDLRLHRLACLIARKRNVLKDAALQLRLGVDPEVVSLAIIRECRDELAELEP